jgi:hypothetical protein
MADLAVQTGKRIGVIATLQTTCNLPAIWYNAVRIWQVKKLN